MEDTERELNITRITTELYVKDLAFDKVIAMAYDAGFEAALRRAEAPAEEKKL